MDGVIEPVDQDVLERIVQVVLDCRLVGRVGFDKVGQRLRSGCRLTRQHGGQELLYSFGIVAAPPLDLLEGGKPVLEPAVLLLTRHKLRSDGLQVRHDLFQPFLGLPLLLQHDPLPFGAGLFLAAKSIELGEQGCAQLRFRRSLPLYAGGLGRNPLQVFLASCLGVAQIRELSGAVEQGGAQLLDLPLGLPDGFVQRLAPAPVRRPACPARARSPVSARRSRW